MEDNYDFLIWAKTWGTIQWRSQTPIIVREDIFKKIFYLD
jgi:hypothetical protein